jgi:hypothetical protein
MDGWDWELLLSQLQLFSKRQIKGRNGWPGLLPCLVFLIMSSILPFICYLIATWLSFCDLLQIKTMDISPILAHGYSTEMQE